MGFIWICPGCKNKYTYDGVLGKKATGKCYNANCPRYRKTTKIYQYREIEKIIIDTPDTPKKVYLSETSDFKRLIWFAIMGTSWRGTNADLDEQLNDKIEKLKKL